MIRFKSRLVLILLLALAFAPAPARADNLISLRSTNEVNSASVRLSDVFSGVPEDIDRPIASAPAPGKSVTYDSRVLSRLAARFRLDWQPQSLADQAVLTRTAARITQDMIQAAVIAKLEEQEVKGKKAIMFDNHSLEVALPADRAPQFALNNFNYDSVSKRFRAELVAETGAAPVMLPITGRVSVKRDVPVLVRRMEAGVTIGKADVDWLAVPEERITGDVITDAAQLIGRELRHGTAEGQPLFSRDVIPPRLVARGSLVTMKIQTPFMLITAQGRALQDGAAGEVVRVTNTQSKRVVEGTVDSAGVVIIHTAQKLALAQ